MVSMCSIPFLIYYFSGWRCPNSQWQWPNTLWCYTSQQFPWQGKHRFLILYHFDIFCVMIFNKKCCCWRPCNCWRPYCCWRPYYCWQPFYFWRPSNCWTPCCWCGFLTLQSFDGDPLLSLGNWCWHHCWPWQTDLSELLFWNKNFGLFS